MKLFSTICAMTLCSLLASGATEKGNDMSNNNNMKERILFETDSAAWALAPVRKGESLRQIGVFQKGRAPLGTDFLTESPLFAPRMTANGEQGTISEKDFVFESLRRSESSDGAVESVVAMRAPSASVLMETHVIAYAKENVFRVWTTIRNEGTKPLVLNARDAASIFLPGEPSPWVSTFGGRWGAETSHFRETRLACDGEAKPLRISSAKLSHNSQETYPAMFVSLDGKAKEESGRVLGAAFGWDGNWQMQAASVASGAAVSAGALEETKRLSPGEEYVSPSLLFSFSENGKGSVSRSFHRYMRDRRGCFNPKKERPVVLNSWEGIGTKVSEEEILRMIRDAASLGAEMFVLDDGWFGGKYPRTQECSGGLGDWKVDARKLPNGLKPLLEECRKNDIRFGLWFEPEMVNVKSELYEKHSDWVVRKKDGPLVCGRGGTQLMLDLAKPEVREHVYHAVADVLKANPGIEYVKWDHNMNGSKGTDSDAHNNGALEVMARLRKEFPKVMFQLCASGGGRADVGTMRFFEEFWASDETNGARRIPIQWGFSHFFPSNAIASHVNKHGPACSYKFRADVAMTGRMGVELRPADLKDNDLDAIRRGIDTYKELRPLLHAGELWRGRSPHESPVTELTIVGEDKAQAVLFAFRRWKNKESPEQGATFEVIRPSGLDPEKVYCLIEQNPDETPRIRPDIVMQGGDLMKKGIPVRFPSAPSSAVVLITEAFEEEE